MTYQTLYDRIKASVELFWGSAYLREYILHLLNDSRDGARQGLPPIVSTYLLTQLREHDASYPEFVPENEISLINHR